MTRSRLALMAMVYLVTATAIPQEGVAQILAGLKTPNIRIPVVAGGGQAVDESWEADTIRTMVLTEHAFSGRDSDDPIQPGILWQGQSEDNSILHSWIVDFSEDALYIETYYYPRSTDVSRGVPVADPVFVSTVTVSWDDDDDRYEFEERSSADTRQGLFFDNDTAWRLVIHIDDGGAIDRIRWRARINNRGQLVIREEQRSSEDGTWNELGLLRLTQRSYPASLNRYVRGGPSCMSGYACTAPPYGAGILRPPGRRAHRAG